MGRPKKYTKQTLRKAVDGYFRSIGRMRDVTELVDSGERDKYGHPVMTPVPVQDEDGNVMRVWEYVHPPTVAGLCRALGVHRSQWSRWHDGKLYPELQEVLEDADDRLQGYLEEQLLLREGKDVRGVEFALSANYGASTKQTVELGPKAAAAVSGLDLYRMSDQELLEYAALTEDEEE